MKKILLLFFTFFVVQLAAQAQQAIAKLKFEEAEEAFNNGQYEATISKLDAVEEILSGTSPRTLYLRILAQDKIVARNPYANYAALKALRDNCHKYLQDYSTVEALEDKYREVYKISEALNQYAKTEEEFNVVLEQNRAREEARRVAAEEQRRQEEIKRQEEAALAAKKAKEAELQAAENRKKWNRSAFALGFQSGDVATYGLSITELNYKKIGFTMSFRSALLRTKTLTRQELRDYQYTATERSGKSLVTVGATIPLLYPLWAYASVGFGNYGRYDRYLDADGKNVYVAQQDETVKADTEIGLALKVGFLVLRAGYSLTNLKEKELTYGVGINLLGRK